MTEPVARVGDVGSHGGPLIEGSPDVLVNGRRAVRLGDRYECAIHGINLTIEGSTTVLVNSRRLCRVLDHTQCGAVVATGSPNVEAGG